jgi:hypothetical protein
VVNVDTDDRPVARGAPTLSELPPIAGHLDLSDREVSSAWQADLERFCGKAVDAIVGDPVLYRMVCDSPELARLLADRTVVAEEVETPTSMDDFGRCLAALNVVQFDTDALAWIRDYGVRIYLVMAPLLRDFTHRADFEHIVRSFVEAIATPENMTALVDGLLPLVDRVFTPAHAEKIDVAIDALLDEVLHPDCDAWLIELIEWVAESLATPEGLPTLASMVRWLLAQLSAPERLTSVIDRVTTAFVEWAKDASDWLAAEDLDIEQAAFWLSVTPNTMHKHIQSRAGTDAQVPVRLVKDRGGRGRGKYYILRRDLFAWARAHWNSPKKRILFPA